jgi:hypothetical protein
VKISVQAVVSGMLPVKLGNAFLTTVEEPVSFTSPLRSLSIAMRNHTRYKTLTLKRNWMLMV